MLREPQCSCATVRIWLAGEVALHLVRHGPPLIEPGQAASTWELDWSRTEETSQLRKVLQRRAPSATWHSSDEPKAVATAQLLTTQLVSTWSSLREVHRADWFSTHQELGAAFLDAFDEPTRPARPGWEPLDQARLRVTSAVTELVAQDGDELVLVGHGTAWTLLVSELTGDAPDLGAWGRLRTPDLCTVDLGTQTVSHPWGRWE